MSAFWSSFWLVVEVGIPVVAGGVLLASILMGFNPVEEHERWARNLNIPDEEPEAPFDLNAKLENLRLEIDKYQQVRYSKEVEVEPKPVGRKFRT